MSTNTKSVPGLITPTVKSMPAATARLSAIQQQQDMNDYQNALINSTGGKRRRKRKGGSVTVPQFQMKYTPVGGPGQTPNDIIKTLTQISTQAAANRVYDKNVYDAGYKNSHKGGKRKTRKHTKKHTRKHTRRSRKGGNSDWKWGCYSGGSRRCSK